MVPEVPDGQDLDGSPWEHGDGGVSVGPQHGHDMRNGRVDDAAIDLDPLA